MRGGAIKQISPKRFKLGGLAMLHKANKNQKIAIEGNKHSSPLVKSSLRVWVTSYTVLQIANKAEEVRPCAIIITKAPCQAHWDVVIVAAIKIPI